MSRKLQHIVIATALAAAVVAAAATVFVLHESRAVVWTAGPGEKVQWLRPGPASGHIFVASTTSDEWHLRDIDTRGRVRIVARGSGGLQSVSLSPISWDKRNVLIGLHGSGINGHAVAECDVDTGRVALFPGFRSATMFSLHQPYSPDGHWLAIEGCRPDGVWGIWLINRRTGQRRLVLPGREICDVSWTLDGRLYLFGRSSGELYYGWPPVMNRRGLAAGSIALVARDGLSVLAVQQTKDSLKLLTFDMRSGKSRRVYELRSNAAGRADIFDVQYASWCSDAVVNVVGAGIGAILVDSAGRAKQIQLPEQAMWRVTAGITLIEPGVIAYVSSNGVGARDEIRAMHVR